MTKINTEPRTYEEPVRTEDETYRKDEYMETHPAYAMIGASRVTGAKVLFGSDFIHQNYICIRIKPAYVRRGLSNDWYSASQREYIEVCLSEAQWAGFVSRMNVSDGIPCTTTWRDAVGYVPQIPNPPERTKQFDDEMRKTVEGGLAALSELTATINEMKISEKQRKDLLWKVERASRSIGGSAKFIAEQFGEHMEKTKEAAKTEVYSFIEMHVRRSGLEAIGFKAKDVLRLDSKTIDAD